MTEKLWISSHSGPAIGIHNAPTVHDASIAMGRLCRYAGHGKVFWPVLLHSMVVADLTEGPAKIYSLIHDVTESMINDIPKPFKIPSMEELEARLYSRVLRDWDLPYPEKHTLVQVHHADYNALLGEIWVLGPPGLKEIYKKRNRKAERLVRFYMKKFPPSDTIRADGRAVREFIRRYAELKEKQNG